MTGCRRSGRLNGYNYAQAGIYFITICVEDRRSLFGEILDGQVSLNEAGFELQREWIALRDRFPHVILDEFVIMPNHIHGILALTESVSTIGLSAVVGAFKSLSTNAYIRGVKSENWPSFEGRLWQQGFHDHIVRGDADLERIRQYIHLNPVRWQDDEYFPRNAVPTL